MDTSDLQRVESRKIQGGETAIFGSSRSPWSRVDPIPSAIPREGATHQSALEAYDGNLLILGKS
eukprot:1622428-Pyramimonas_sp.AAC.1